MLGILTKTDRLVLVNEGNGTSRMYNRRGDDLTQIGNEQNARGNEENRKERE
jgi:hypothetical protein